MKGWAKMNVTYPGIFMVENMLVVNYGSTSNFACLVSVQYTTRKTQNQMKGTSRRLEHI